MNMREPNRRQEFSGYCTRYVSTVLQQIWNAHTDVKNGHCVRTISGELKLSKYDALEGC